MATKSETVPPPRTDADTVITRVRPRILNVKTLAFLIIVIIAVLKGALLAPRDFFVNVTAGIVDVFLGFTIAVVLFDQYYKAVREEQWRKVRQITYASITTHLSNILAEVCMYYGGIIPHISRLVGYVGKHTQPNAQTLRAINLLLGELNRVPVETGSRYWKANLAFLELIAWDLERIGDILTPRVLEFSDDKFIIDALVMFDQARETYENAIRARRQTRLREVFSNLASLVLPIRNLYQALMDNWIKSPW